MSSAEVIQGFVECEQDGVVLAYFDDDPKGRYFVEFDDATEVAPSVAELPCFGGEPAEWFAIETDDGDMVHLLRREPDGAFMSKPLSPADWAEIQARMDELWGPVDGEVRP